MILTRFVRQAGHGDLDIAILDEVETTLGALLLDFDETGKWSAASDRLIANLIAAVNEYDRLLGMVRMEVLVKGSAYLDRLVDAARTHGHRSQSGL